MLSPSPQSANFAAIRFFLTRHNGESPLATLLAALLGGIGLTAGLVLMVENYKTLTSSTVTWINELPWLLVAAAVGGAVVALVRPPETASDIDEALHAAADQPSGGRAEIASAGIS